MWPLVLVYRSLSALKSQCINYHFSQWVLNSGDFFTLFRPFIATNKQNRNTINIIPGLAEFYYYFLLIYPLFWLVLCVLVFLK